MGIIDGLIICTISHDSLDSMFSTIGLFYQNCIRIACVSVNLSV